MANTDRFLNEEGLTKLLSDLRSKIDKLYSNTIISNPNLLDNWYFADPINQRGQTEYNNIGYGIDRWKSFSAGSGYKINSDGLLVSCKNFRHAQPMENASDLIGKTLTASFLFKGNTSTKGIGILTVVGGNSGANICSLVNVTNGCVSGSFVVSEGFEGISLYTPSTFDGSVTIIAAKLELGDTQTLAHQDADGNWVLNDPPPNKQQELAKCQRYLYVMPTAQLCGGFITGAKKTMNIGLPVPVPMRVAPVISSLTITGVRTIVGTNLAPEVTAVNVIGNAIGTIIPVTVATETFNTDAYTNNTPISCYVAGAVFSAEL